MKSRYGALIIILVTWLIVGCSANKAELGGPRVFLSDPQVLAELKTRVMAGDSTLLPALRQLVKSADLALQFEPVSVMDKPFTPPSGDKHDYMSIGPYWWPDPAKPDGLPYIRRDGQVNPERNEYDRPPLGLLDQAVDKLAQAYYFTNEEKYASHATELISTYFFDDSTRMNPHMYFAQAIPGRSAGRGIGIIEARSLFRINESVGLLEGSVAWTTEHQQQLVAWMSEFLDWLLTSGHGRDEAATKNNHGTWYDVTTCELALFVGREDVAGKILAEVPQKRIDPQIAADGSQPHELARTKSFSYSVMNLQGMFFLATLAEPLGIDLWSHTSSTGGSIGKALEFLLPFSLEGAEWPYRRLRPWSAEHANHVLYFLRVAAGKYDHIPYPTDAQNIVEVDTPANPINLKYPWKLD